MRNKKGRLFTLLIVLLIVSAIFLLVFMWSNLNKSIELIAKNQIKETTQKFTYKLDSYFDQIRRDIKMTKELADNGFFEAEFDVSMNNLLFPIFNTSKQISTFAIARTDGNEFSLLREGDMFKNNLVYETDSGMNIYREQWILENDNREILKTWTDTNAGYDPRTRTWFIGASKIEDNANPFWSQPYKNFFNSWPGITVSMKANSKKEGEFNIVQYDIFLTEISQFTKELCFGKNGLVFILSENCEFIGLPKMIGISRNDSIGKYLMEDFSKINYQPINLSVANWEKQSKDSTILFSYYALGEKWWACLSKYYLDNDRYFVMGVIVPESDFLSDIKNSRNIIVFCGVIFLFFILVVALGYFDKQRANRILTRQKKEIELQKSEIIQQKEEIISQRDEIEAQRDELSEKNHVLVEQKKEITDSINYAKRIQNALLPSTEFVNNNLGNHFIIFRPKDVVSGDFYWSTQINNNLIITVADCTGHGVPGAFMSMLGVSFLNEIVRKKHVTKASEVLDHLRESVIEALKQSGHKDSESNNETMSNVKDGMDISLVVLDLKNNTCQWAGANNPLWIIRKNIVVENFDDLADVIEEYKPDKMPIAIHDTMNPFTNHEIVLNTGDRIFLLTDGYPDQFGGEKGKKFLHKRLKRLLVDSAELPIKQQGLLLSTRLDEWMNSFSKYYEQVDDITIIGFEVS
ncbi:MAG: SpoIIE family protein phosphatase [Bacteroidales bacterium]|nr:SpoIIE family protein phosphatase [Bacteroidales bacterium]